MQSKTTALALILLLKYYTQLVKTVKRGDDCEVHIFEATAGDGALVKWIQLILNSMAKISVPPLNLKHCSMTPQPIVSSTLTKQRNYFSDTCNIVSAKCMTQLLYWTALDYTGVHNVVGDRCAAITKTSYRINHREICATLSIIHLAWWLSG